MFVAKCKVGKVEGKLVDTMTKDNRDGGNELTGQYIKEKDTKWMQRARTSEA